MNITLEKQPQCLANLRTEFSTEEVQSRRLEIVNSYAKQAKVPGFRAGKTPRKLIERRFSKNIAEELEQRLINDGIGQAVKEKEISLLQVAEISEKEFSETGEFTLSAELILTPEFTLPEYTNIPIERPSTEVTQEQLDQAEQDLRERFADFNEVTDRPVKLEDLAVIDYQATIDGTPLREAVESTPEWLEKREGHWLKIQESEFLPGLAEGLVGAQTGETRTVEVTFGAEYSISDLQEKTASYEVTVKEIKESILPELDDAFAQRLLGEESDLEKLREVLSEQQQVQIEQAAEQKVADEIVNWINENIDLDLPERFIQLETQGQARQIVQENIRRGVSQQELESNQEELMAQASTRAKINLKTSFVLQKIAEKEELNVEDQELLQRIYQIAQQQQEKPEKLLKTMQKENKIQDLRHSLLLEKTLAFLAEKADITSLGEEEKTPTKESTEESEDTE